MDRVNPGVLATVNVDGSPQTSVVWLMREGDEIILSSEAGRRKVRNVARDGRVSLCVFDLEDPLLYVEVRGHAAITIDEGRTVAAALANRYEGPNAGDEYLALPEDVVRLVIRITPSHVAGSAS